MPNNENEKKILRVEMDYSYLYKKDVEETYEKLLNYWKNFLKPHITKKLSDPRWKRPKWLINSSFVAGEKLENGNLTNYELDRIFDTFLEWYSPRYIDESIFSMKDFFGKPDMVNLWYIKKLWNV
ncbi:hypothetical protein [Picrophilus oshimae]|uniref:Uncharacterized protein n=1 Tax=Picrophilus torridus (strain ATCC 700027 / DSM 9790 / JCM 10055 / NBRC 100828 / KAW 2/3) TaxID=1122961 RepID=A0A8G2FWR3_PICTO|nr:hypothetical protein [Picrophilus oshimae]SMD30904.1 hypothetical protein SAMN02745355_0822 [Picrophilus oshimae DSM 9789]